MRPSAKTPLPLSAHLLQHLHHSKKKLQVIAVEVRAVFVGCTGVRADSKETRYPHELYQFSSSGTLCSFTVAEMADLRQRPQVANGEANGTAKHSTSAQAEVGNTL
jgi:hypothetical protein